MPSLPGIVEIVEIASIAQNNGQHVGMLAFLSVTTAQPFLVLQQNR
jgi:hypothetical protein